jgi:hypothetical protein
MCKTFVKIYYFFTRLFSNFKAVTAWGPHIVPHDILYSIYGKFFAFHENGTMYPDIQVHVQFIFTIRLFGAQDRIDT